MKKHYILLLLTLVLTCTANAQSTDTPGWNFPQDPEQNKIAREKNALYTDYMTAENYEMARAPLYWLLQNVPDLNESIYINGARIYENLADSSPEGEEAKVYADSAVLLYDLRIEHFNKREEVLNRKAFSAYKMWRDYADRYEQLYHVMKEAHEANGQDFWPQNAVAYMDAARRYKLTGGEIGDMDIVNLYNELDGLLEEYQKASNTPERTEILRGQLDKLLVGSISSKCEDIEQNLGSLLRENPENLKLAKVIIKLSLESKCTDSPSFLQAAELVQQEEPSVGLARFLASKAISAGDFERAIQSYENAIALTEENTKKAEMLLDIAEIHSKQGRKAAARDYAQRALEENPNLSEAYNLIGNLYYSSYNDCRQNVSQVEDRAVFIAAYEMYQKAGNATMMAQAQEQFPTISMLFEEADKEAGEQIRIGCWINRSVAIRTAPRN